jgi:hypothetical protein
MKQDIFSIALNVKNRKQTRYRPNPFSLNAVRVTPGGMASLSGQQGAGSKNNPPGKSQSGEVGGNVAEKYERATDREIHQEEQKDSNVRFI